MISAEQATIINTHEGICIRIPLTFKKRGGRKEIILPEGLQNQALRPPRSENALIRALARGHCWKELLERGRYSSIEELAKALGVNGSYVGRHLNLMLLAPDIVEAILLGREPEGLSLDKLRHVPPAWEEQRVKLGFPEK